MSKIADAKEHYVRGIHHKESGKRGSNGNNGNFLLDGIVKELSIKAICIESY